MSAQPSVAEIASPLLFDVSGMLVTLRGWSMVLHPGACEGRLLPWVIFRRGACHSADTRPFAENAA
jgi:hypothetical protein